MKIEPRATCDVCDDNDDALPLAPVLRHFGKRRMFAGTVVTVQCHEDNSRVKELVAQAGDDRVLVVDGGGSLRTALLGDMLATSAAKNGWAGLVVDGCVRDAAVLATLDIGIMARAAMPKKSRKDEEGQVDVPIDVAGVRVHAGDTLYADDDGVVIVRRG